MKNIIIFLTLLILIVAIFYFKNDIKYQFYRFTYFTSNTNSDSDEKYKKELDISYVDEYNKVEINSKNELINAFYTALNNGYNQYNVYCAQNYATCIDDLETISKDDNVFSIINNFVNPYNSFVNIETKHDNFMNIKWKINKLYNDAEIIMLEEAVDSIYTKLISSSMNNREKIKVIHDYIINNTKYDSKKAEDINNNTYRSNTAYGVIFEHYGICSGYSDAMALFLNKMGIPNYKIATEKHVWNYAFVDGYWLHLDLTWDDPVTNNGSNVLSHNFFLIDTETLLNLDRTEHNFDTTIYLHN